MIFMASTKINPTKTAGEIQLLLSKHGVSRIQTSYKDGEISGLDFIIEHDGREMPFCLPIRWQPVLDAMLEDYRTPSNLCTEAQARRTSWRIILRWIQAQMAFIKTGQVDIKEVFMPYMIMAGNKTLYEKMSGANFKQIEYKGD